MKKKIGVIVGSLRKESFSKKLAKEVIEMASEKADFEVISIGKLPLYNQDYDDLNEAPEEYNEFRQKMAEMDGFLFVTPEYNRTIPAVLKNALDVGSRPYGKSVWTGKPGAIISNSPGGLGGFGSNHHLRQALVFLNVYTMQQPELYISNVADKLDEFGKLKDEDTKTHLKNAMQSFMDWCNNFWD